jgi:hypothetical protein
MAALWAALTALSWAALMAGSRADTTAARLVCSKVERTAHTSVGYLAQQWVAWSGRS